MTACPCFIAVLLEGESCTTSIPSPSKFVCRRKDFCLLYVHFCCSSSLNVILHTALSVFLAGCMMLCIGQTVNFLNKIWNTSWWILRTMAYFFKSHLGLLWFDCIFRNLCLNYQNLEDHSWKSESLSLKAVLIVE